MFCKLLYLLLSILAASAQASDTRGNPLGETRPAGQAVTLAYDGHGRLTSYARSGEASLTHSYNGLDDRVATSTTAAGSSSADTRRFVYAPDGRVMGEYGSSASDIRAEFIWMAPEVGANDNSLFGGDDGAIGSEGGGYMPLAVAANDNISGPQLLWVHANHMGVPAVFTNATGAQVAVPASYSLPGFPGQSHTFADLYYNRYRDYDPSTGRYIQADPIGLAGGASPYSYAMNSPLRHTDPTGEFVPAVIVGGLVGGGLDLIEQLIENGGRLRCISGRRLLASTALGAVGGGFGGRGLQVGLRRLTNKTKGKIGEGLSISENRLRLSRLVERNRRIAGHRAHHDSMWRSVFGNTYYVESKFGQSTLSAAQRAARDALGDSYHIERWGYEFFGRVGGYFGGAASWSISEKLTKKQECECQ